MTLFLCRHGQTYLGERKRKQGRIDNNKTLLSKQGYLDVEKICSNLYNIKIKNIFCSPLRRTIQTATLISTSINSHPKIYICHELIEMNFGEWEGLTNDEIMNKYTKNYYLRKKKGKFLFKVPGGESYEDVFMRAKKWINKKQKQKLKNSLIVGHDVFIRGIIYYLKGIKKREALNLEVKHGEVWKL